MTLELPGATQSQIGFNSSDTSDNMDDTSGVICCRTELLLRMRPSQVMKVLA